MWKKISLGAVSVLTLAALAGYVATRPSTYRVERSVTVAADPAVVLPQLADLQRWIAWSPWERPDPNLQRRYAGVLGRAGHSYYWATDGEMGRGRMTVILARGDRVEIEREVVGPKPYLADIEFSLDRDPAGTRITWVMTGDADVGERMLGGFRTALQRDLDKGLGQLKALVEAQAKVATYRVERSVSLAAPPGVVFAQVADLHRWAGWSPWESTGAGLTRSYGGPPTGAGSSYYWRDDESGRGRLTILGTSADHIELELAVEQPAPYSSDLEIAIVAEGAGTRVTWVMTGENDDGGSALQPSGDAERVLGSRLEKGLASLKRAVEVTASAGRRDGLQSSGASKL